MFQKKFTVSHKCKFQFIFDNEKLTNKVFEILNIKESK